eukprot:1182346-Prorocentrum_minimum.AAC.2
MSIYARGTKKEGTECRSRRQSHPHAGLVLHFRHAPSARALGLDDKRPNLRVIGRTHLPGVGHTREADAHVRDGRVPDPPLPPAQRPPRLPIGPPRPRGDRHQAGGVAAPVGLRHRPAPHVTEGGQPRQGWFVTRGDARAFCASDPRAPMVYMQSESCTRKHSARLGSTRAISIMMSPSFISEWPEQPCPAWLQPPIPSAPNLGSS